MLIPQTFILSPCFGGQFSYNHKFQVSYDINWKYPFLFIELNKKSFDNKEIQVLAFKKGYPSLS